MLLAIMSTLVQDVSSFSTSLEAAPQRPSAQEVLRRVMILTHIHRKGASSPPEEVLTRLAQKWAEDDREKFAASMQSLLRTQQNRVRDAGLWNSLEESELQFMETGAIEVSMRQRIDSTWVIESIGCLCWALGFLRRLPPYDQQSGKEAVAFPQGEQAATLLENAQLRFPSEIDRQRDWAELWHWRARTHMLLMSGENPPGLPEGARLTEILRLAAIGAAGDGVFDAPIGNDFPAFGKPYREVDREQMSLLLSIARERHKAFNWLCGFSPGNRWSDTPTDT